jgi:hypothetical protein
VSKHLSGYFLNLGPPSKVSVAEAAADIQAMLWDESADFVVGCESVAKGVLPSFAAGTKVRDRSSQGRANVYGYFRGKAGPHKFADMSVKFKKEPGRSGLHAPRAFFKINYQGVKFIVAHHPPNWPGTDAAREEHLRSLRHEIAPWSDEERWGRLKSATRDQLKAKPTILLWDRNMNVPPHRAFAESCDATAAGVRVDSVLYRNLENVEVTYSRRVGPQHKHRVHTDHPWGAMRIELAI